jgi:NAD(P)H-dependent FMN reductase
VTPEYHNSIPGVFKNAIGRHRRARDSDVLDRFIQQAVMQVLHRLDGSLRRQVQ